MKKLLLFFISISFVACKSPEEKLQSKICESAKNYLSNTTNTEISDLKIKKIDTITEKRELEYIYMLVSIEVNNNRDRLQKLKNKWEEYNSNYKAFANYDNTGYWDRNERESYAKYKELNNNLSILQDKSNEFKNKSIHNKSKKALRTEILFSFKSKDNIGLTREIKYALPFNLSGDLLDQENVNRNIFKKYDAEYLLYYIEQINK